MKVYYMNGAGNDFMVLDARGMGKEDFSGLAKELCALNGADGFMAVDHSNIADFRLHFYNSDGSRGEMCGNGARCICRFAYDLGIAGKRMTVETDAGEVPGFRLDENLYCVHLNLPGKMNLWGWEDVAYVELGDPGVPHVVAEYRGDLWADAEMLKERMRALRHDPRFPKGANINFFQFTGDLPGEVRMLTFERGVEDFTRACGTGCGATAVMLRLNGWLPSGILTAHNRGGTLTVEVCEEGANIDRIKLTGPTEIVKIFEIDL